MPTYEVSFTNTLSYVIEITAKDEEAAREKFEAKAEKFSAKQLMAMLVDDGEFEIDEINEV